MSTGLHLKYLVILRDQDQKIPDMVNMYFQIEGNNCLWYVVFIVYFLSRVTKDVGISDVAHVVDDFSACSLALMF